MTSRWIHSALLTLLAASCVTGEQKSRLPERMSKENIRSLANSVFEIIIPKIKNDNIRYHEPLPKERIPIQFRNSEYTSVGTAFAVDTNRFVSAAHVFEIEKYATDPSIMLRDQKGEIHQIDKVYRYSAHRDLVVFSLKTTPKITTPLRVSRKSEVGDVVYTVGNAYGEGISFRDGQIANYTPEPFKAEWKYIRYTAAASPGNSGGPLLNTRGEVLGIVTMKNESENLNFAVPFSELRKLSRREASFFQPINSVTSPTGRQNVTVDFSVRLPAKFTALSKRAKTIRERFWVNAWKKIYTTSANKRFPLDPAAQKWLRRQEYASVLSFIGRNDVGDYEMETRDGRVIPRANGDQMRITFDGDDLTIFNYLPDQPGKHAKYLKSPDLILDGIIESQGWVREIAEEQVPIASLGPPVSNERFIDPLGRPWLKSVWRTPFDYMTHVLNCMPVPKGFSCLLYHLPTLEENTAYQYRFEKLDTPELALSYSGTPSEWQGYLSLPKSWLPNLFSVASVKQVGKNIAVNLGPFRTLATDQLAGPNSIVFAGVGFNAASPQTIEIHGLRFTHGSKQQHSQEFFPSFAPSAKQSREEQFAWNVLLKSGGMNTLTNETEVTRIVVDTQGRPVNPAAPKAYPKVFEFSCRGTQPSASQTCNSFLRSTEIGRQAH
jgi:hypothetical protein